MKKRIEELLSGKFEYEQPGLLFSQDKISVVLKAGEVFRGEVYIGTEENQKIQGYITSSNRRFVPGMDQFSGTTIRLQYGVDGVGMKPGDRHEGWLCFTTSIGEYKLPFEIEAQKEQVKGASGEIGDIKAFAAVAKNDFREAYRLFTDPGFELLLQSAGDSELALYKGLSCQPVTYQNLEEFFIGLGEKEPVRLSLGSPKAEFYEIRESVRESFRIQRNGWGHLRLDIETRGDFLEVSKHVVTDEDFIGSHYQVDYVIRKEKLGKGLQFGEIVVRSPYQELVCSITASTEAKVHAKMDAREKQQRLSLLRDLTEYSCGKMEFSTWAGSSHFILNQLREAGNAYPEYQMYEAYILYLEERKEEAADILREFSDRTFSREEIEMAGFYLYLCTLLGLYKDKDQAVRRLQNFYMQKEDSFLLFWMLLKEDPSITASPSRAVFMMEEIFEKGCRSPLLYLEAWKYISRDMSLLHRLGSFWPQVFLFAAKKGLLTEELVMRLAYLTSYEKTFNRSLYRALAAGYESFPSDDTLESICRYIMLGNPRQREYFRWFSLAVERGLRITRLYEYYVETMDTSYQRDLPKPLLMYFTYNNNTLGDGKKAFIYAGIVGSKDRVPQTYEDYLIRMEEFAKAKAGEGCMNESYAVLYQEFLSSPQNRAQAEQIAEKMFTCRLYCDDKKIRKIIVRHNQMAKEESFPCAHGVAYPRIYTEDAVIMFQDDKQRRYTGTVDYNIKKLFDEHGLLEKAVSLGAEDPGVLLNYCENNALNRDNLDVFRRLSQSEAFSDQYRRKIRGRILDYYAENVYGEDLDEYLKKMDYREYADVDRTKLLEILITRGLFTQAMGIVEEFGYEGLDFSALLRMTSRMIVKCDLAEDDELLALSSAVYRSGKYDEVILKYLMLYRFGPTEELFSIWQSAKGFDMDTYDLEERILELLMFTGDFRKDGEKILKDYVRHAGKERIISAYLTQVAYGTFVREYPMSSFVRERLEYAYEEEWPMDLCCRLALLKAVSRDKEPSERILALEAEILEECVKKGMVFSFFKRLPAGLLSPYQLDDKTFVEYHTDPRAKVTLCYALDTGLGAEPEYKSEPL